MVSVQEQHPADSATTFSRGAVSHRIGIGAFTATTAVHLAERGQIRRVRACPRPMSLERHRVGGVHFGAVHACSISPETKSGDSVESLRLPRSLSAMLR